MIKIQNFAGGMEEALEISEPGTVKPRLLWSPVWGKFARCNLITWIRDIERCWSEAGCGSKVPKLAHMKSCSQITREMNTNARGYRRYQSHDKIYDKDMCTRCDKKLIRGSSEGPNPWRHWLAEGSDIIGIGPMSPNIATGRLYLYLLISSELSKNTHSFSTVQLLFIAFVGSLWQRKGTASLFWRKSSFRTPKTRNKFGENKQYVYYSELPLGFWNRFKYDDWLLRSKRLSEDLGRPCHFVPKRMVHWCCNWIDSSDSYLHCIGSMFLSAFPSLTPTSGLLSCQFCYICGPSYTLW